MYPIPPITQALMLVCTGMFCLVYLVPGIGPWLALWPLGSGAFQPWQLVSYGLLHGDMLHLALNMFGMWMFGSELERLWGGKRYLQFLLAGLLTAAATQLVVTGITGSMAPTVVASGALFALLLAFGMLFPNRIMVPLFPPIPMKARTFVMVFGGIELLMGIFSRGSIAHFAHLGGMLGGWLMIRYWRGQSPFGSSRRR